MSRQVAFVVAFNASFFAGCASLVLQSRGWLFVSGVCLGWCIRDLFQATR